MTGIVGILVRCPNDPTEKYTYTIPDILWIFGGSRSPLRTTTRTGKGAVRSRRMLRQLYDMDNGCPPVILRDGSWTTSNREITTPVCTSTLGSVMPT